MPSLFNQPTAHRFGNALSVEIDCTMWTNLEIAVAWIRRSGMDHLGPKLSDFLSRGNSLRITVGVDINNTSKEGLEEVLKLSKVGNTDLWVYHDEGPTTFHPKLYLFSNATDAKLIVGSNNITASGLFTNVEAGLEYEGKLTDSLIQDAVVALASWRDPTTNLALPLNAATLKDLVAQRYVLPERDLAQRNRSVRDGTARSRRKVLFGRASIFPPPKPKVVQAKPTQSATPQAAQSGRVLLMRVRKAGLVDRPTQTQIPQRLYSQAFFSGVTSFVSSHDGRRHSVGQASARGIINTLKLEIPEMRTFIDPVLRMERRGNDIYYESYDSSTPGQGQQILRTLEQGLRTTPISTFLTVPSSPASSTWWRFV